MTELSAAEQLMHTTVRLECELEDGSTSTGTGFFFSFKIDTEKHIPLIVTNKHVIRNAKIGNFTITLKSEDGKPQLGTKQTIKLENFESLWIGHPEDDIDIAVFPIAPLVLAAKAKNSELFYVRIDESIIPSPEIIESLSGIDDVVMIGYPNGLWDALNNMPIVRRGITATSLKNDYNGNPIFVIDCACFPGSSGSPVFIFNQNGYTDVNRSTIIGGSRLIFVGILFAGPQHTAEGEILTIDVPLQQVPISLSKIPNNLGFVVKSEKLLDFKPILEQRLKQETAP